MVIIVGLLGLLHCTGAQGLLEEIRIGAFIELDLILAVGVDQQLLWSVYVSFNKEEVLARNQVDLHAELIVPRLVLASDELEREALIVPVDLRENHLCVCWEVVLSLWNHSLLLLA